MNVNEWLRKTQPKVLDFGYGPVQIGFRPRVECNDGYSVSIQASSSHYCDPRRDNLTEYTEVELGYPNMADNLIADYAEDPDDLCNTVYGYVPIEAVDELLAKHGGIKET